MARIRLGGKLTVNGWWARATLLGAAPRAVEFVGTFSGDTFQNAGLGQTLEFGNETWAMFGIAGTAGMLNARINAAGTIIDFAAGGWIPRCPAPLSDRVGRQQRALPGGWRAGAYVYGTLSGTMRPIASDFGAGGGALAIDWMRMSPYPAAGSFTSRVFDAGSTVGWQQLTADELHPVNTSVGFEVRSGNVACPMAAGAASCRSAAGPST